MVAARRYARAVFELAQERGEMDTWRKELGEMSLALQEPGLMALLKSPKLPFSQKKLVLEEKLKGLSPMVLNLASLLVLRDKLELLNYITQEYERLVDAHRGIVHVELFTAVPLEKSEIQQVTDQFSTVLDSKVVLKDKVEPALLGGLRARIGDRLIDGSVKNRLELLRRSLAEPGRRS